ncbi:glycoside hydrolase family 55 protein [Coniophora puteana RWD-64-598 SS2]|uniref:Glycoside hydrolase family 55 protein n=1 Tax=Coniophora puteana (strain RWD-64-598) TaxID=741705 RepID=A0A5M3N525_CONPW|nr:glycoside hydrolase family 55 protein [Coniophora puteana RWD-64-598 SS2]EIW85955.1 glycoside hydrolase family 55 protein [Coniophora puteana RWD-64-598 SS2]
MLFGTITLTVLSTLLSSAQSVAALGSTCTTALGGGTAGASDPFWLQNMKHQGTSAFNADPSSYAVYRNVQDYGAKGDGSTDDTAAIMSAMTDGGRCGDVSCASSTLTPAILYFPSGTYVVSSALSQYYYTQMVGDARNPPTLKASAGFSGFAVIDSDPYIPAGSGAQWFVNQDNFFRSIRNFVIDTTAMPASAAAIGIHWQVSQATSLFNVVFNLNSGSGTQHKGMFMENGSGGWMGDIVVNGGNIGLNVGNQQFTVRNVTINNAVTAISGIWNWGFTYQGLTISNCQVGLDLATGGLTQAAQTVGSVLVVDAVVTNTPIFIQDSTAANGGLSAGSLVLSNVQLNNVPTAVTVTGGTTVLAGGSTTIDSWAQGFTYSGTSGTPTFTQGTITGPSKDASLLDSAGRIFGKTHPQYESYAVDQFVSVKTSGAKGDGSTDDTAALQAVFDQYAGCKIIFFDAGTYYITDTLTIPAGTQIVGEAWSTIMAGGSAFSDITNPKVAVQIGSAGDTGVLEITDMLFSTKGPAPGAIMVEWNVHDPSGQQGAAGMWDTHMRFGGATGTNLANPQCPQASRNAACQASYLGLHLTSGSSAYIEGTWVWTADHDLDTTNSANVTVFSGRGILSESQGPVWLIGTSSEHAALYQYNLVGAKNHWIGFAQTETPYYQPQPAAPAPFSVNSALSDPTTFGGSSNMAWGMNIQGSSGITIFGGGFYSFFNNYDGTCNTARSCQDQVLNIDSTSSVNVYGLSTLGTPNQLSVGGTGVIAANHNGDGFQDTATAWTS